MKEHPILQSQVTYLISDPRTPTWLKSLLTDTLKLESLRLFNFSDSLRKELQWKNGEAFVVPKGMPFEIMPSMNEHAANSSSQKEFQTLINDSLKKIADEQSDLLRQDADGSIKISQDLYDYLNERHSFEMEFRTLLFMKSQRRTELLGGAPDYWHFMNQRRYDLEAIKQISRDVIKIYRLNDRGLKVYFSTPLNSLLGFPLISEE